MKEYKLTVHDGEVGYLYLNSITEHHLSYLIEKSIEGSILPGSFGKKMDFIAHSLKNLAIEADKGWFVNKDHQLTKIHCN